MNWLATCVVWCAACGGYLLYAGELHNWHELVTAAVLASGATVWTYAIRRSGERRFALSREHATEYAKAVAALGPAIARTSVIFVTGALLGRTPGRMLRNRFLRGAEDGAADAARRASALLIASLGPDNFVVRDQPGKRRVLMHAIVPDNAARDPRWLNQ